MSEAGRTMLRNNYFLHRQPPLTIITYNILNYNVAPPHLRPTSFHTILAFGAPLLLNFVQVKYQGTSSSPFTTQPVTATVAVGSLLSYIVAYAAGFGFGPRIFPTYLRIVEGIVWASGGVLLGSLASILLSDIARPVLYLFYVLLLLRVISGLIRIIYRRIVEKFVRSVHAQLQWLSRSGGALILDRGTLLPL